jgi:hypothetical protein
MEDRRRLSVAAFVGASLAYIFTVLSFTGQFDVQQWAVFTVVFFAVFFGFERFLGWAAAREAE